MGGMVGSVITGALLLIPALIVWFVLKLIYKALTKGKTVNIKVTVIVWFVIFILPVAYTSFRPQSPNEQSPAARVSRVSILEEINKIRANNGLPTLKIDEKLCAYAKKLALVVKDNGEDAAGESYNTDLSNPEIIKAYFSGFKYTDYLSYKAGIMSDDEIAAKMATPELSTMKVSTTHGCVVEEATNDGTGTWVIFVGAEEQ